MAAITFVYSTFPARKDAVRTAAHLLNLQLIACANIFPIASMYWWEGKIARGKEFVLIAKTDNAKFGEVRAHIRKMHPYKVPCILKISAHANKEYYRWLKSVVH